MCAKLYIGTLTSDIESYVQENGCAGRDGLLAVAVLYYDKLDLTKVKGVSEDMKNYCRMQKAFVS